MDSVEHSSDSLPERQVGPVSEADFPCCSRRERPDQNRPGALLSVATEALPRLAYVHGADHDPALTHPARFRPVTGSGWVKPDVHTGLWTAPVTATGPDGEPADTTWLQWCRSEEYNLAAATHLTEIVPSPRARVLLLDTHAHLARVVAAFPAQSMMGSLRQYPDWPALAAAGWDAVYLTDDGQWATRMSPGCDLYGWDCATVLWLRPAYTVGMTVGLAPSGVKA